MVRPKALSHYHEPYRIPVHAATAFGVALQVFPSPATFRSLRHVLPDRVIPLGALRSPLHRMREDERTIENGNLSRPLMMGDGQIVDQQLQVGGGGEEEE